MKSSGRNGRNRNADTAVDCGATYITEEKMQAKIAEVTPDRKEQIEGMNFGAFTEYVAFSLPKFCMVRNGALNLLPSLEQSIRDDMQIVKAWPGLKGDVNVLGYVYDLADGLVKEVKP